MKKLLIISTISLLFISCNKDIDLNNPDVDLFVEQLKAGTYDNYEKGEKGENLWLLMPNFDGSHIAALIEKAKDTTHIADFPTNPISSRMPHPQGRDYFILGECLLWTVEGIRNGSGFGSLDPFLIDASLDEPERGRGLTGTEILIVRDLYKNWWDSFKNDDWESENPFGSSTFRWF